MFDLVGVNLGEQVHANSSLSLNETPQVEGVIDLFRVIDF